MRALVRVILASLLLLALDVTSAAAANTTPDTAVVVSAANPSVGGNLVGTTGGAFRYYRLDYVGATAPVQIHLTWNPGWQSTGPAFGFNVYGPGGDSNGLVGSGVRGDDAGPASTANYTLSAPSPGTYYVQVYSYTNGTSNDFTLDFTGLGQTPTRATGNVTPEKALAVSQPNTPTGGQVTGNRAGAYGYFNVDYPGGYWPMTVSVTFSPASLLPTGSVGLNVYDGDDLVAQGSEVSRTFDSVTVSASVNRVAQGSLLVQVGNYADGVTATYGVGISGLVGPIVQASGNGSGDRAIRLSPQTSGARGSVAGSSAGAYGYYWLDYQGNNELITISMPFKPGRNVTYTGVNFSLYRGSELVGTGILADGHDASEGVAYLSYSSDQAGPLTIQVHNYIPGVTADYSIYALGLKR